MGTVKQNILIVFHVNYLNIMHALPFSNSDYVSSAPFNLIHSDIWGPAPHVTIGGSRYLDLSYVK